VVPRYLFYWVLWAYPDQIDAVAVQALRKLNGLPAAEVYRIYMPKSEKNARVRAVRNGDGKKVLLSLQIAETLEADISRGALKEHERLPSQEELCDRFSVSSSVVREAIHLLKAKNIVYTVNGVGSFIAERSVDPLRRLLLHYISGAQELHDYSELMELRLAIETTCAGKIAEHGTPEALKSLHASLKIMESAAGQYPIFSDADVAFHSAIVDYSGNSLIKAIHSSLRPTIRRFMSLTCTNHDDILRNCREHGVIYAAIAAGDPFQASEALRNHLAFAHRNYGLLAIHPAKEEVSKRSKAGKRSRKESVS
jgi:GntR family transcriptional regulator, transcriptional repressor for pyruvate dehydrogenase complex